MKIALIRWQDLFGSYITPTYDKNMKVYLNRPYRPYANKKDFYMHSIANLRIGQSITVKNLSAFTLRLDWIGHIKYHLGFKYEIQQLDDKIHKITRAIANKNYFLTH